MSEPHFLYDALARWIDREEMPTIGFNLLAHWLPVWAVVGLASTGKFSGRGADAVLNRVVYASLALGSTAGSVSVLGCGDYMIGYLGNKGPQLRQEVMMAMIKLVCRITKLAWFDKGEEIRRIVSQAARFLEGSVDHAVIGLRLLNELVQQMNTRAPHRTITQHRKTAVSFRDIALLHTFETACTILNHIATRQIQYDSVAADRIPQVEDQMLQQGLTLVIRCLSFDFIGTNPDDSAEDSSTIQVTSAWRSRMENPATLRLFFALYRGLTTGTMPIDPIAASRSGAGAPGSPAGGSLLGSTALSTLTGSGVENMGPDGPLAFGGVGGLMDGSGPGVESCDVRPSEARAAETLEALTLLASVRRSLFGKGGTKAAFLQGILQGVVAILRDRLGLTSSSCYHQFCRLLHRVKANYHLSDLVCMELYPEWIELTAQFTVSSFQQMDWARNSVHYLLALWSRMVAAAPYVRLNDDRPGGVVDPQLERFAPEVAAAYLSARVDGVEAVLKGEAEDDLEESERVEAEVEALPALYRFQYHDVTSGIQSVMDPLLRRYNELLTQLRTAGPAAAERLCGGPEAVAEAEGRLSPQLVELGRTLCLVEQQLAWLVYVCSAVVSTQNFGGASTTQESLASDAVLLKRLLQVMDVVDRSLAGSSGREKCDPRLEMALLYFVSAFRRVFVSEQSGMPTPAQMAAAQVSSSLKTGSSAGAGGIESFFGPSAVASGPGGGRPGGGSGFGAGRSAAPDSGPLSRSGGGSATRTGLRPGGVGRGGLSLTITHSSAAQEPRQLTTRQKMYLDFFERVGEGDHTVIISKMVNKLCNNLRYWSDVPIVIDRALTVLHELAFNFSSGRLLNSLDAVDFVLQNHGPENFPFLMASGNARSRTRFYTALSRLLFMQEDPEEKFNGFMQPMLQTLERLDAAGETRSQEIGSALEGVARDLRGVVAATHNRRTYTLVFDTLFPGPVNVLSRAVGVWADTPKVVNPLLKFFTELAFNRSSRINFGASSPNGVILFQTIARIIPVFAERILAQPLADDPDTAYPNRHKGVMICLTLFTRALDGGYCPFGVFELYQDPCLDEAMNSVIQLCESIPSEHLHALPKLARAYYQLMSVLCKSHLAKLAALPGDVFLHIMTLLKEGLDSYDPLEIVNAAAAVDHLATAFVRGERRERRETRDLQAQVRHTPHLFETLMQQLFNTVAFGETSNVWSLSRPLLSLMIAATLVRQEAWPEFRESIIATQTEDVHGQLREDFDRLMTGISGSLDGPNRERFAQRITVFRYNVRDYVKL